MIVSLRRTSQILFLILFFFLFFQTELRSTEQLPYPVAIFLHFDPLVLLSTILTLRGFPPDLPFALVGALVTVLLTLLFGRVFCGWICPLGTILHAVSWLFRKLRIRRQVVFPFRAWQWKYFILAGLMGMAVLAYPITGLFDPLCLLVRSLTITVKPVFDFLVHALFGSLYKTDISTVTAVSEPIYEVLRSSLLSFRPPVFRQIILVGGLFVLILWLNRYHARFWCRAVCPLGALLGLVARGSFLQLDIDSECSHCGLCAGSCAAGAIHSEQKKASTVWRRSECMYCFSCRSACPNNSISFSFRAPWRSSQPAMDLGRRRLLTSGAAAVTGVAILRLDADERRIRPEVIRPPGAVTEDLFLQTCIRCGTCMKVCPTHGLQPVLFGAGLAGLWTPALVPVVGYCEFNCNLCGQICPTGAIRRMSVSDKQRVVIGEAFLDGNRCLPYAYQTTCIVCEEHCPTSPKAIWFQEREVFLRTGEQKVVKQPIIDLGLCTGCGICENKCPVGPPAAIRVFRPSGFREANTIM